MSRLNQGEEAVQCARLLSRSTELETTLYTRPSTPTSCGSVPVRSSPDPDVHGGGDRDEMRLKGDGEFDGG